jgi:hypothetical protein
MGTREVRFSISCSVPDTHGVWVSASDIGRTPGQFQWIYGSTVDKSMWASGQPDLAGAGKEACVYFHYDVRAIRGCTLAPRSASATISQERE